jgi:hypothetical protein
VLLRQLLPLWRFCAPGVLMGCRCSYGTRFVSIIGAEIAQKAGNDEVADYSRSRTNEGRRSVLILREQIDDVDQGGLANVEF